MKIDVILPCGGSGTRAKLGYNKLLFDLGGITVIEKTLSRFYRDDVDKIVISCSDGDLGAFTKLTQGAPIKILFAKGGRTRGESVFNALSLCDSDFVAVHDGARPFVTQKIIDDAFATAQQKGSAVACVPVTDSLRRKCDDGTSVSVDRSEYYNVQTPQVFPTQKLLQAYELAKKEGFEASDDAQIYEKYIAPAAISQGGYENVKITTANDLALAIPSGYRVGTGWDTHRLVEGRKLILAGVDIPHDKGLLGHSDADVLAHAVMDAILGAVGKRDIGVLFPDTDDSFKDADSMKLLDKVVALAKSDGYVINNLSAVILAQKPKLMGYIPAMVQNLASALGVSPDRINVAVTTTEKIGDIGREEAISASAYCSLFKRTDKDNN